MATQFSQKPVHSIIIDTGPLIRNVVSISTIINAAEEVYTTPAIISEIRDAATRSRVETTLKPFLNIRNPSPASYDIVASFAKKTGDFAVLSRQDLGILALAYDIHCERHGGPAGLRTAPGQALTIRPEQGKKKEKNQSKEVKDFQETKGETGKGEVQEENPSSEESSHESNTSNGKVAEHQLTSELNDFTSVIEAQEQPAEQARNECSEPAEATQSARPLEDDLKKLQVSSSEEDAREELKSLENENDSSDGEWITPTNLAKHQAKAAGKTALSTQQTQMSVATMTTDFAMQNVLLQMNLNLLSPKLQRIKQLKTHILRCHACFTITKQMDKQFCPRCGQATLTRVSCSTNTKGEFKIHLAKNYQYNNRGNRFSIPKPMAQTSSGKYTGKGGGKNGWAKDLVLAEDQKEYMRGLEQEKRTKTRDLMDEDYLPGILTGDRGRAGGRPKVGAGRNINSRKRY